MIKRNILLFACLLLLVLPFLPLTDYVSAEGETNTEEVEQTLDDTVTNQLSQVDLSRLQEFLDNLDDNGQAIFGTTSIWDKVNKLLAGELDADFATFLSIILDLLFGNLVNFLPLLCSIIVIGILCNLVGSLSLDGKDSSVGKIIEFVCFGLVVVIVTSLLYTILNNTSTAIFNIKTQMDAIFPIILTMIASLGGTVTVGIFQPTTAILSNIIVQLFSYLIIPLFTFCFIFIVIGNISSNIKLDKFQKLFNTIFKWVIGTIFGLFSSIMVIQGIVAGSFDSMSIKAAKFAIKSYVPILGGYLSDGLNFVAISSILIKNAVGVVGLLLLFGTIISPLIEVIVFSLGLQLVSAILEPLGADRISNFLHQIAKLSNYLITIILAVGFMYVLSVGLLMCTTNLI